MKDNIVFLCDLGICFRNRKDCRNTERGNEEIKQKKRESTLLRHGCRITLEGRKILFFFVSFMIALSLLIPLPLHASDQRMECDFLASMHCHTSLCYDDKGNLICQKSDTCIHHHDSNCYLEDGTLWCPLEEVEEHHHTDRCLPGGQKEAEDPFSASEESENADGNLMTSLENDESQKTRTDTNSHLETDGSGQSGSKFNRENVHWICGKEEISEHVHDKNCYDEKNQLICTKTEVYAHQHDENCLLQAKKRMEQENENSQKREEANLSSEKDNENSEPDLNAGSQQKEPADQETGDNPSENRQDASEDQSGKQEEQIRQKDVSYQISSSLNGLNYEDDSFRAMVVGDLDPGVMIQMSVPIVFEETGFTMWTFTMALFEQERSIEPDKPVHVTLLFRNLKPDSALQPALQHKKSIHESEWLDVNWQQKEEGLEADFDLNSFSEFELHMESEEHAANSTTVSKVQLYDINDTLVSTLELEKDGSLVLPFDPIGAVPSSGMFLGWSTAKEYIDNGEAWKSNPLYAPGTTLLGSEIAQASVYRLYPVWAPPGANYWADFFIRLDGTIPVEPTSNAPGLYTSKIPVMGGMQWVAPYVDPAGIEVGNGGRLAKEPSADQLESVINPRADQIGYGAKAINGVLYKTQNINGTFRLVDEAGQPLEWEEGDPVPDEAVSLSVLWYVIKKEYVNWHVDGVLLESSKLTLIYTTGSADLGEVTNMPNGLELSKDSEVHVGHNLNDPGTAPMDPVREGYEFMGWQDTRTGVVYQPGTTFMIEENTVLQALWKPANGNSLTLNKIDTLTQKPLSQAQFTLEEKNREETNWTLRSDSLRTQSNGSLMVDSLQTDKIYRLSETKAPGGYHLHEPVCFRIYNLQGKLSATLCDESGNQLGDQAGIVSYVRNGEHIMVMIRLADMPYLMPFRIQKLDADTKKPLAQAEFKLVQTTDGFLQTVDEGTTGDNGMIVWRKENPLKIRDGTYQIIETRPADGYQLCTQPIEILVENGQASLLNQPGNAQLKTQEDETVLLVTDQLSSILPESGSGERNFMNQTSLLLAMTGCLLWLLKKRNNRCRKQKGTGI